MKKFVAARLARMKRPPRRAIPTRAGLFALASPIILGVAAVNASNNLLFILLGGILGSIVLSGILSERNMRGVRVAAKLVSSAYAGESARVSVAFIRDEGGPPAFGLRVREIGGEGLLAYFRSMKGGLEVQVPVLEDRRAEKIGARFFAKRGRAEIGHCELTTRYPFGLLIKARDAEVDVDVLVRPKRIECPKELEDPRGLASDGDASEKRGLGLDVYGLRERDDRDPMLRVHALRSLALGRDVVIETAGVEKPIATIGIANFIGAETEAFERALEVAQATLVAWDARGFAIALVTATELVAPDALSMTAMLDKLALLSLEAPELRANPHNALWIVPRGANAPAGARVVALVDASGRVEVRA